MVSIKHDVKQGVLVYHQIRRLIQTKIIHSSHSIEEKQFQPTSLDLRLGETAYRIRASFLPESSDVTSRLRNHDNTIDMYKTELQMYEFDIRNGAFLERDQVYLVPLLEELRLPRALRAKCNPKSTTGRLDIFTRVITDRNPRFDDVPAGYQGKLYLEIVPRSFTIKVRTGLSLNQIRFFSGEAMLSDIELHDAYMEYNLLYAGDEPVPLGKTRIDGGLFLKVDLSGSSSNGTIAYKSKKRSQYIDLEKTNFYRIEDFWEPIQANPENNLILEPEEFYILLSKEKIRVPPRYAAEMLPFEAGSGELRTHYAGFFDAGFGFGEGDIKGTKVVLEVRAHDVPFLITDNQTLFKVRYERTSSIPKQVYGIGLGSSYQFQTLSLSKQFKWKR